MADVIFADTNLFLRYLTNDDVVQADAVESVLHRAAAGEIELFTNTLVIAEIIWVLSKVYKLSSRDIRKGILGILNTPGIRVETDHLITQAVEVFATKNIDFVDAYSICWMEAKGITAVYTFDQRHFSRVAGIDVKVPGQ
ncbi:MAG: PIN domain-containing protein [Chloroflexota bacterium]|jgi:uncharacterized protein